MAHGAQHHSARLHSLHRLRSRIDWSEFTVVTAADIPGKNHIQLIFADQPCLADGIVNHCDEAILSAGSPRQAQAARGRGLRCTSSTTRCRRLHD
jgi:xanthine dehydrogenase molybdopterin-binding subunit B